MDSVSDLKHAAEALGAGDGAQAVKSSHAPSTALTIPYGFVIPFRPLAYTTCTYNIIQFVLLPVTLPTPCLHIYRLQTLNLISSRYHSW